MFDATQLLTIASVSLCLSLAGCHNDDHDHATPAADADTDHGDHDHADHGDHDHADHGDHDHGDADHGEHDHADHGDHDHGDADHPTAGPLPDSGATADPHTGPSRSLGEVTIAGATLEVSLAGAIVPNSEAHLSVHQTAGPPLSTLRLWIGDEAATGSVKTKSDGHDGHFHAHVETPPTIAADAQLWLEAQNASGKRVRIALPL
jgi:hypothetical protein